jgi:hypothetical protein
MKTLRSFRGFVSPDLLAGLLANLTLISQLSIIYIVHGAGTFLRSRFIITVAMPCLWDIHPLSSVLSLSHECALRRACVDARIYGYERFIYVYYRLTVSTHTNTIELKQLKQLKQLKLQTQLLKVLNVTLVRQKYKQLS